jgi:copper chaperone CopZ
VTVDAVHIRTEGFYCGACPKVVENALGGMEGVSDVVSVRSLGLTSVLYDPQLISRENLCERIRQVGFNANPVASNGADEDSEF